jgi:hypothetical protein
MSICSNQKDQSDETCIKYKAMDHRMIVSIACYLLRKLSKPTKLFSQLIKRKDKLEIFRLDRNVSEY